MEMLELTTLTQVSLCSDQTTNMLIILSDSIKCVIISGNSKVTVLKAILDGMI